MSRPFDRPIVIERQDPRTEKWSSVWGLHASVNKSRSANEYLSAGATQAKRTLVFEVRYFAGLAALADNTQMYRVVYEGIPYNIEDYDDYMEGHKTVKLLGVSY